MGLRFKVERNIDALRKDGAAAAADRLENRIEALRDQARDLVERNLLLFARGETEKFREGTTEIRAAVQSGTPLDLDRMRILVRAMAKRLAARYAKTRRRRLRGQLDRPSHAAAQYGLGRGAVPSRCGSRSASRKPRVMVLCDVSGSVKAAMAQFLLMFLYALNEASEGHPLLRLRQQPDRSQRHP